MFFLSPALLVRVGSSVMAPLAPFPASTLASSRLSLRLPCNATDAPGTFPVEVAAEGGAFLPSNAQLELLAAPLVDGVAPFVVAAMTSTAITVTGRNFAVGGRCRCRIDGTVVVAVCQSASSALCRTPLLGAGTVAVELSLNGGACFSNASAPLQVVDAQWGNLSVAVNAVLFQSGSVQALRAEG